MEILGYELQERTMYDCEVTDSIEGGNIGLICAKIIYDSIKLSKKKFDFLFRWKYSTKKLMKKLTKKEILEGGKHILILEGRDENDLGFINLQLGTIGFDEYKTWLMENKKKVESVTSIMKV